MTAVEPGGARVPADPERLAEAERVLRRVVDDPTLLRRVGADPLIEVLGEYARRGAALAAAASRNALNAATAAEWVKQRDEARAEVERLRRELVDAETAREHYASAVGVLASERDQARAEVERSAQRLAAAQPVDLTTARTVAGLRVAAECGYGYRLDKDGAKRLRALMSGAAASGDTATTQPRPLGHVDIPAWFRAAADAVEALDWVGTAYQLRDIASQLTPGDPASDEGAREAEAAMWRAFVSNVTPAEAVPAARPGGPATASAWPSPDDIEYDGPDHPLEDYRTWRRYVAVPVADDDAVEVVGVVPPRDLEPAPASPDGDELLLVRLDGRKGGRVTIGHSRLPVETIVGALVAGTDHERITAGWPGATPEVLRVLAQLVNDLGLRATEPCKDCGQPLGPEDDPWHTCHLDQHMLAAKSPEAVAFDAVARCFADGAEVAATRSSEFYMEIAHQVVTALRAAGAVVPDPDPTTTED